MSGPLPIPPRALEVVEEFYRVDEPAQWLAIAVEAMAGAAGLPDMVGLLFSSTDGDGDVEVLAQASCGSNTAAVLGELSVSQLVGWVEQVACGCSRGPGAAVAQPAPAPTGGDILADWNPVVMGVCDGAGPVFAAVAMDVPGDERAVQAYLAWAALTRHIEVCARLVRDMLVDREPLHGRVPRGRAPELAVRRAAQEAEARYGVLSQEDATHALDLRVAVASGHWRLAGEWNTPRAHYWVGVEHPESGRSRLTHRQAAVVECLSRGMTNAEIGESLGMSEATVGTHIRDACRRLQVRGRVGLLATLARLRGLVSD